MSKNDMPKKKLAGKETMAAFKRLMGYIVGIYKVQFIIVLIAIVLTSIGQVVGIMEMRYLIDDYITPFIGQKNPVLSELFTIIATMATAYGGAVFCYWL